MLPGYGVNFDPKGEIYLDLKKWDIFVSVGLPRKEDYLTLPAEFISTSYCSQLTPGSPTIQSSTCELMLPLLQYFKETAEGLIQEINRNSFEEIPALLPHLSDWNDISSRDDKGRPVNAPSDEDLPEDRQKFIKEDAEFKELLKDMKEDVEAMLAHGKDRQEELVMQALKERGLLRKIKQFPVLATGHPGAHPVPHESRGKRDLTIVEDTISDIGTSKEEVLRELEGPDQEDSFLQSPSLPDWQAQFSELGLSLTELLNESRTEFSEEEPSASYHWGQLSMEGSGLPSGSTCLLWTQPEKNATEVESYCRSVCQTPNRLILETCLAACLKAIEEDPELWPQISNQTDTSSIIPTLMSEALVTLQDELAKVNLNISFESPDPTLVPTEELTTAGLAEDPIKATTSPAIPAGFRRRLRRADPSCMDPVDIGQVLGNSTRLRGRLRLLSKAVKFNNFTTDAEVNYMNSLLYSMQGSNLPPQTAYEQKAPTPQDIDQCVVESLGLLFQETSSGCYTCIKQSCVEKYYVVEVIRTAVMTNPDVLDFKEQLTAQYKRIYRRRPCYSACSASINRKNIRYAETRVARLWAHAKNRHERRKRSIALAAALAAPVGGVLQEVVKGAFTWDRKGAQALKEIRKHTREDAEWKQRQIVTNEEMFSVARALQTESKAQFRTVSSLDRQCELYGMAFVEVNKWAQKMTQSQQDVLGSVGFNSWLVGTLQPKYMRYIGALRQTLSHQEDLKISLNQLSNGQLSQAIVAPYEMACYLKHVQGQIAQALPDFELALEEVNSYYDAQLVSFVVDKDVLVVDIPVFLKEKASLPLTLYKLNSVAVPADPAELGPGPDNTWVGDYTQIKFSAEYAAIVNNRAALITADDLREDCLRLAFRRYCLTPSLTQYTNEHSCAMAVFADNAQDVSKFCKVEYIKDHVPHPSMLSDQHLSLIVAMPTPWSVSCDDSNSLANTLQPSPMLIIKRKDFCACTLTFGPHRVTQDSITCMDVTPKTKVERIPWYTVNTAVAYGFRNSLKEVNAVSDSLVKLKTKEGEKALSGRTTSREQVDLSLPDLAFLDTPPEPNFENLERSHLLDRLPLDEIVKAATLGKERYFLQDGISKVKRLSLGYQIVIGLGSGSVFLSLVAIALAIYKTRKDTRRKDVTILSPQHPIEMTQFRRADVEHVINEGFEPSPTTARRARSTSPTGMYGSQRAILHVAVFACLIHMVVCKKERNREENSPSDCLTREDWQDMIEQIKTGLKLFVLKVLEGATASWYVNPNVVFDFRTWTVKTWFFFTVTYAGVIWSAILTWKGFKVATEVLLNRFRTYVTHRKTCASWLCQRLNDQCDMYFQISTYDCASAAAIYLGTLLGPPIGLKFLNSITIKDVHLVKGWFSDTVQFRWANMELEYQGVPFKFPDQVNIRSLVLRKKLRHFFSAPARTQLCNLSIVNQDSLLLRHIKDEFPARPEILISDSSDDHLPPGCFSIETWDARISHCYHHFLNPDLDCNNPECPAMMAKRLRANLARASTAIASTSTMGARPPPPPKPPRRSTLRRSRSVVFPAYPSVSDDMVLDN